MAYRGSNREHAEEKQIYHIPANFSEGTGLFGGMVKARNFLEGVILALPMFFITYKVCPFQNLNFKMTFIGLLTMIPLLIGCVGINGDPVSSFLGYFLLFRGKRRTMRYNPRVKLEFTGEIPQAQEVPIEKIRRMLRNLNREDATATTESDRYFAADGYDFEDDIELRRKMNAMTQGREKHGKRKA